MKPVYFFLDPAIISTNNIEEYYKEDLINKLTQFYNRLNEIEKEILKEGEKKKIFFIPIKLELIFECLNNPPSTNSQLNKVFYKIFTPLLQKYVIYCNNQKNELDKSIYSNPNLPDVISELFNNFLGICQKHREITCICKDILDISPIFISSSTNINLQDGFIWFENPNEIIKHLPLLNIYPNETDTIKEKIKKMRLILILNYYRRNFNAYQENLHLTSYKGNEIYQDEELIPKFRFHDGFWRNRSVFNSDIKYRLRLITVMTDLVEDHSTLSHNREKLKYEKIRIGGKTYNLESCYLFQERQIFGVKSTPRLRFSLIDNMVYFVDIIDKH